MDLCTLNITVPLLTAPPGTISQKPLGFESIGPYGHDRYNESSRAPSVEQMQTGIFYYYYRG